MPLQWDEDACTSLVSIVATIFGISTVALSWKLIINGYWWTAIAMSSFALIGLCSKTIAAREKGSYYPHISHPCFFILACGRLLLSVLIILTYVSAFFGHKYFNMTDPNTNIRDMGVAQFPSAVTNGDYSSVNSVVLVDGYARTDWTGRYIEGTAQQGKASQAQVVTTYYSVSPVFPDSYVAVSTRPSAWVIGAQYALPTYGRGGGLCGYFAGTMPSWGQGISGTDQGYPLYLAAKDAASRFGFSFEDGLPMLVAGNPEAWEATCRYWYGWLWISAPALLLLTVVLELPALWLVFRPYSLKNDLEYVEVYDC
mmetsp:Transcript_4336/g.7414  ORF Transcript_4336/g.7414 Transcript_4336/m.7414 type:complete len:312 (-) Transcript_4336:47-982(-)